jgi:hypothetical protein
MVYEDPITEKKPEGKAKIVRVGRKGLNGLVHCIVNFLDDGPGANYFRTIKDPGEE